MNTWVSFQSAEQPLLGQFSVSGNTSLQDFGSWLKEATQQSTDFHVGALSDTAPKGLVGFS
ncbi:hypothetical protein [Pseudomonas extremaustralis]|uniref:hypothetical protein n=1 Tax=Pseudomonas extremaustralis TaxID=359110 RepID=UPI0023DEA8C8|nr:hypothetical protein [Pseudomonas extremaustralis]MDF3132778.1 hypothetical protein [Pseudomonas extremaustralis]